MKPLLKWAGGKRQLAPILKESFPQDWDKGTYIEPFVGGAAMFLYLNPKKSIIADINVRLYSFYVHIKEQTDLVFAEISKIAETFNSLPAIEKKDFYLKIRNDYNLSNAESVNSAVLLYALNKLCFNGLYRENLKGGFNVPFGQKEIFPPLVENDFQEVARVLKNAIIKNSDFETTISNAKSGDFVYLDPPYIPIDLTSSFTSYHSQGFGIKDQERLASTMKDLEKIGVRALCSNSDTPISQEIFGKFNLRKIQATRMVSAKSSGRGTVSELVITNY
jgi:DNA adenine methylase